MEQSFGTVAFSKFLGKRVEKPEYLNKVKGYGSKIPGTPKKPVWLKEKSTRPLPVFDPKQGLDFLEEWR